jgi:hypothetical protein
MVPQSSAVETTAITNAGYEYVPSTYLICEDDKAVPPHFQEMFATAAGSKIERCNSGHSPMLSQKDKLVETIVAVVDKCIS